MDPLSITASVTALVTLCGQVLMLCSKIPGRVASIRRTLINLSMEVSTYHASLLQIQLLLTDQHDLFAKILEVENEWTKSFDRALSGCTITISILINKLEKEFESYTGSSMSYTLKEQALKDLMGELRGQQQGLQVLISSLNL